MGGHGLLGWYSRRIMARSLLLLLRRGEAK